MFCSTYVNDFYMFLIIRIIKIDSHIITSLNRLSKHINSLKLRIMKNHIQNGNLLKATNI
jgi:hypothetical protein